MDEPSSKEQSEWPQTTEHYVRDLEVEIKRLQSALKPFAAVAKGIDEAWPGQCALRVRERNNGSEYFTYHVCQPRRETWLPTLAEWREAAAAAGRSE